MSSTKKDSKVYYNFYENIASNESDMFRNLNDEMIHQFGMLVKYLPRTQENLDRILGEDNLTKFENSYDIIMLPEGLESWNSGSIFFSKFGMTIDETITLWVEQRRFIDCVNDTLAMPRIGDLIYIPIFNSFFEITYTDNDDGKFFNHGQLHVFHIEIKKMRYSHETINTGDTEIDSIVIPETINQNIDNSTVSEYNLKNELLEEIKKFSGE